MEYSNAELAAHVARRLGFGRAPTTDDPSAEVAAAFDTSRKPATPPTIEAPSERDDATRLESIAPGLLWWLDQMALGARPIHERLVWFWHDHFAIHARKVMYPYLAWLQHLTIRRYATSSFADLLVAMATDPAMLMYLDGVRSTGEDPNENHAREMMELHSVGPGNYTQDDVANMARALTGWVVKTPFIPRSRLGPLADKPDWQSLFVRQRWDSSPKTFLGQTGEFAANDVVAILLDQPATATFIAVKMYRHIVGLEPTPDTAATLASEFRQDWNISALVRSIAEQPAFLSAAAVRSKVRTPIEKAAGVLGAFAPGDTEAALPALHASGYVPMTAPNPAGFPKGEILLDPHRTVHTIDFAGLAGPHNEGLTADELLGRLGIHDVSTATKRTIEQAAPGHRLSLAVASPEFALV